MILKVDHVGIAVAKLDDRLGFWHEALGLPLGGIESVPTEGVRVAFLPSARRVSSCSRPHAPTRPSRNSSRSGGREFTTSRFK